MQKAESALERAVELNKNNADALLMLARVQEARGSMERAAVSYERLIQQNPRDVRSYVLLGALEEKGRMIYNIGNGQGFTVLEVIESVKRVTGRPIPVEECERRAGDPAVLVASSEKIKAELGWRPKFAELDAIVASAWEWHQKRYA